MRLHVVSREKGGHHGEYMMHISGALDQAGHDLKLHDDLATLKRYELEEQPDGSCEFKKAFFPRINTYLKDLLQAGRLEAGPAISGIWFGPQSAAWVHGGGIVRRLKGLLELYRLRCLRNRSNLQRLYILNDERTARFIQRWVKLPGGVIPLADPVDTLPDPSVDYREKHGIPDDAIVFGLIGAHRSGKGVQEALSIMAEWKPKTDKPVVLLLAGECLSAFEEELQSSLSEWESEEREVRLITDLRFLPREDLAACFTCSDYLLMPYRNVYGSSGILGHAARYRKPVLASEGGLIGHLTREYGLGYTFDPAKRKSFVAGLDRAIAGKVTQDELGTERYLNENSVESFQQTLLEKEFSQ